MVSFRSGNRTPVEREGILQVSWIVSLFKLKREVRYVEEAKEEDFVPLGTKAEVFALLRRWFPDGDFSRLNCISLDHREEVCELIIPDEEDIADEDTVNSIGFQSPSYRILRDVCRQMNWKALNPSDGEFIDFDNQPPDIYTPYFGRRRPQPPKYGLVDFIVYLRDQVIETWAKGDKKALEGLANTLATLNDGFETAGYNSPYWVIVDKLAYFARYHEFADYQTYIPSEDDIRRFDTPDYDVSK